MMLALLGVGRYRATGRVTSSAPLTGALKVDPVSARSTAAMSPITGFALVYLLLRGFAEGCAAMTGTEAISNGVMAFKAPAQKNAATTLGWMVGHPRHVLPRRVVPRAALPRDADDAARPCCRMLGHHVFGGGPLYYALQYTTFAVLVLAANTAFADFPRLAGILAQRPLHAAPARRARRPARLLQRHRRARARGDAARRGSSTATRTRSCRCTRSACSSASRCRRRAWSCTGVRTREPGWRWKARLNGIGAVATGARVASSRSSPSSRRGGWIVAVIIPLIIVAAAEDPPALRANSPRRSGSRGRARSRRCITR